jgi:hypothetical protein
MAFEKLINRSVARRSSTVAVAVNPQSSAFTLTRAAYELLGDCRHIDIWVDTGEGAVAIEPNPDGQYRLTVARPARQFQCQWLADFFQTYRAKRVAGEFRDGRLVFDLNNPLERLEAVS